MTVRRLRSGTGRPVRSALENLAVATLGGGSAHGIGLLFDRLVNGG